MVQPVDVRCAAALAPYIEVPGRLPTVDGNPAATAKWRPRTQRALTARRNAHVEVTKASTHTATQMPRSALIVVQFGDRLNDSANASTA